MREDDRLSNGSDEEINTTAIVPISTENNPIEQDEFSALQSAKVLMRFAAPLLARSLILATGDILKPKILSWKNETLLAGYQDAYVTHWLIASFLYGAISAIHTLTSQLKKKVEQGEAEPSALGNLFRQSTLFAATIGLIGAALAWCAPYALQLAKQPKSVIESNMDYFPYAAAGLFFDALYRSQIRFMVGQGIRKTALLGEIIDISADLAITSALIFNTSLGLGAAALGFTLSKIITLFFHTLIVYFSPSQQEYQLFRGEKQIDIATLKLITQNGIPKGVNSCVNTTANTVISFFCGLHGTTGLTALQVASLYNTCVTLPMGALSQATSVNVGKWFENKESRNAISLGNANIFIATCWTILPVFAAFFAPEYITRILINPNDPSQKNDFDMAVNLLRIQGPLTTISALYFATSSALSGLNDNVMPMKIAILCNFLINLAAASVAVFALKKDETWIYGASIIGMTLGSAILLARWISQAKAYQKPSGMTSNHSVTLFPTTEQRLLKESERIASDDASPRRSP